MARLLGQLLTLGSTGVHNVAEFDFLFTRPVQYGVPYRFGQGFEGRIDVKLVVLGQALQHGEVIAIAPVPAFDGTTGQAQAGEGNDPRWVEKISLSQAIATRAGTYG